VLLDTTARLNTMLQGQLLKNAHQVMNEELEHLTKLFAVVLTKTNRDNHLANHVQQDSTDQIQPELEQRK
jgi:hypothetical protein